MDQPDIAAMQRICNALVAQRNAALDACANLDARVMGLLEENATLRQRIETILKCPPPPAPAPLEAGA